MSLLRLLTNGTIDRAKFFLALAVLLIGLAHISLMPPFEGFDESAHYSSMRQIASTGTIPEYGLARFDKTVEEYEKIAPMSYRSLPPFSPNGMVTYSFFAQNPNLWKAYPHEGKATFQQGERLNWQAQHPPLYYMLMAPFVAVSDAMPIKLQFFFLRVISYLMAFVGLFVSSAWIKRLYSSNQVNAGHVAVLPFVLPFLSPMFFPEFARLGNDSLCLLLLSSALYFLQRWQEEPNRLCFASLFGIALSLGLITKAFFIPLLCGFCLFLFVNYLDARKTPLLKEAYKDGFSVMILPVAVASLWYVYKIRTTGSLSGGADFIALDGQGGWLEKVNGISIRRLFIGAIAMIETWFGWTTGSLGAFKIRFNLPIIILNLSLWGSYVIIISAKKIADKAWIPIFLGVPVLGGLGGHILATVALTGNSQTPGWYLNILAPLSSLVIAICFSHSKFVGFSRLAVTILLGYVCLFIAANFLFEAFLYGGCIAQNASKTYTFANLASCAEQSAKLYGVIGTLAWPKLAITFFFFAYFSLACGFFAHKKVFVVKNPF